MYYCTIKPVYNKLLYNNIMRCYKIYVYNYYLTVNNSNIMKSKNIVFPRLHSTLYIWEKENKTSEYMATYIERKV